VAAPEPGFAAFLDGSQESHAVAFHDGVPVVVGQVAAVIRSRVERRMTTWGPGPLLRERLYVPLRRLPVPMRRALASLGLTIVDFLPADDEAGSDHPYELLRRAVHAVQADREAVERELAEAWCERESSPLYVDGGLPQGDRAARSELCIGVVKSHHTLYVHADRLPDVLSLPEGSRSPVVRIERTWGPPVASWYLRLRGPAAHDPLRGLVRVEAALAEDVHPSRTLSHRADRVSAWILAERSPLALPDTRWDRMVYGVRDCEEYLRAVAG
jgi:hypothetical protein